MNRTGRYNAQPINAKGLDDLISKNNENNAIIVANRPMNTNPHPSLLRKGILFPVGGRLNPKFEIQKKAKITVRNTMVSNIIIFLVSDCINTI